MADDQDDSQKTEEPTHKRLEDAYKKGQVVSSREVQHFFMLFALAIIVLWQAPGLLGGSTHTIASFIERPETFLVDERGLGPILTGLLMDMLTILAPVFVACVIAALAAGFLQHRFVLSLEPIIPKWEKVSLQKGIKRLFSMRSLVEFLKGIIKITIVGVAAYLAVRPYLSNLTQLPAGNMDTLLAFLLSVTGRMLIAVCIVMFFIAALDYLYQYYEFMKSLRMSKQEIRDEYKQQEGDPVVKQRLKSLRMERARKRMMAAVPKADVVITNPTHYAVALKYEMGMMGAPVLVAKGVDAVAMRIRTLAREHEVPVVENPPLARALHNTVDLDEEIPFEHYKAVAEVISYVYKLKGRRLQ